MEFTNAFRWLADPSFVDKFNNNSRNCSISIFNFKQDLAATEPEKL